MSTAGENCILPAVFANKEKRMDFQIGNIDDISGIEDTEDYSENMNESEDDIPEDVEDK